MELLKGHGRVNNLRTEREEQRLSLRDLAHFTGCAHTTLSRLEKGEIDVSASLKARIARALGVPVGDLWPVGKESRPPR